MHAINSQKRVSRIQSYDETYMNKVQEIKIPERTQTTEMSHLVGHWITVYTFPHERISSRILIFMATISSLLQFCFL